jgi:GT2 family glycosyltransferase
MESDPPPLAVVIVNFNTRDLLDRCLRSVRRETLALGQDSATWVVDNASSDGSAEMVRRQHPWANLVELNHNLGYAGGCNVKLDEWSHAGDQSPALVLVLNPDTELEPGSLALLAEALSQRTDAAVAGPQLVYPDGSFQHSAFRFPGFVQTILDIFPVSRLAESALNGRYSRDLYASGRPFTVDFPLGACMLVRGSALVTVGPMDSSYFMYCEEIDWCRRFKDAGLSSLCVPRALVVHHAGASTSAVRSDMLAQLWRSRLRYFARHERPWRRALLSGTIHLGLRLRLLIDRALAATGRMSVEEQSERATAFEAVLQGANE